jgi:hypothetical protein
MSPADRNNEPRHQGPNGDAFIQAQRDLRERNDEARRVGKQERADEDRRAAALQRKRDGEQGVYR